MDQVVMSDSRRRRVTGCSRAYYFSDIMKLRKKRKSRALRLGSYWHKVLEILFYPESNSTFFKNLVYSFLPKETADLFNFSDDLPEINTEERVELALKWLKKQDVIESIDESFETTQERSEILEMVAGMLRGYVPEYKDFLVKYEVLETEYPYFIRIKTNPHHTGKYFSDYNLDLMPYNREWTKEEYQQKVKEFKAEGGINFVQGWIDMLVRDRETDLVFAVEHKTAMELGPDTYERKIKWSFQIIGYSIAGTLYAILKGFDFGGYIYNVARKAVISLPTLRKCPKCKGEGQRFQGRGKNKEMAKCEDCDGTGIGGINKTSSNIRISDFEDIIVKYPHLQKYVDAGDYDKYLNKARGNNYFWQHKGSIPYTKMAEWLVDSVRVCGEERRLKRMRPDQYIRHINNFIGGCLDCEYNSICFADSPEDLEFLITELYDCSLEKKKEETTENNNEGKSSSITKTGNLF